MKEYEVENIRHVSNRSQVLKHSEYTILIFVDRGLKNAYQNNNCSYIWLVKLCVIFIFSLNCSIFANFSIGSVILSNRLKTTVKRK